jgi:hypothetical protein
MTRPGVQKMAGTLVRARAGVGLLEPRRRALPRPRNAGERCGPTDLWWQVLAGLPTATSRANVRGQACGADREPRTRVPASVADKSDYAGRQRNVLRQVSVPACPVASWAHPVRHAHPPWLDRGGPGSATGAAVPIELERCAGRVKPGRVKASHPVVQGRVLLIGQGAELPER